MLKSWCPVDIMQLFSFIDYSFDVRTFQESDFSDYFLVWNLLLCKIVMGHMPDCFKAIGERNVSFFSFMLVGEPLKDFLIFNIFVVQFNLSRLNGYFCPVLLRNVFNGKIAADEDKFFLWIACDDSLIT